MKITTYVLNKKNYLKVILKINGYIFRISSVASLFFAFLISRGQLLKERICSTRSRFFPLREDPHPPCPILKKALSFAEANWKSQKLFPFLYMAGKKHEM